jgi:hypothetical protein
MEKKLYRVKVVLYIMAENESDACVAATQARFDIFECTARKAKNIDPGWNEAIPYNAENDRTCAEIMNNAKQIARPETHIVKLPPYVKVAIRDFNIGNRSFQQG